MNKLVIYGVVMVIGAGAQAGMKWLAKHERKRRMDPSAWSPEELAKLVALKKVALDREREMAAVFGEAMGLFEGRGGPKAVRP